jgi:carbamoyl-phosphate synthase small subunit
VQVSTLSQDYSHWRAVKSLSDWMKQENIPGIYGVDTRALTKLLREHGTMLAKLVCGGVDPNSVPMEDPNKINLVAEVSCRGTQTYNPSGDIKITVIDCGMKLNQLRCLVNRGAAVTVVPWDHDIQKGDWDGLFVSNGPGDPMMASTTISNLRGLLADMKSAKHASKPIFGICLGHQVRYPHSAFMFHGWIGFVLDRAG